MRRSPLVAAGALLLVTVAWGSTFLLVKDAVARMPVGGFLAWRFAIATIAMAALRPGGPRRLGPGGRRRGGLLGLALGAGYLLQTYGLTSTPASVSGFITGMFVVFTPLIAALVLRRRVGGAGWAAVVLATAGLALLSLRAGGSLSSGFGVGELLTLGCAVAFAVHIVGLGEWSAGRDPAALATVQLGTVTVLAVVTAAVAGESLGPPPDLGVWGAVVLTALAATAAAFVVQTWAQSILSPTRAAVIMTMEPVFAGIFGVAIGGDRLGTRGLLGAVLVVGAMLLVEGRPRRRAASEVARLEV